MKNNKVCDIENMSGENLKVKIHFINFRVYVTYKRVIKTRKKDSKHS